MTRIRLARRFHKTIIGGVVTVAAVAAAVGYAAHTSPVRAGYAQPPGGTDPRVTQANIQDTICVSGYTAKVRPSASYTSALKAQQMKARHLPGVPADYEEDHAIPLEVGGDPVSDINLWPELYAGD